MAEIKQIGISQLPVEKQFQPEQEFMDAINDAIQGAVGKISLAAAIGVMHLAVKNMIEGNE